jgi:hypothetical protein
VGRPGLINGLLTAVLVACGLLVAVLLYGFATRTLTPRTTPTRAVTPDTTGQARAQAAALARITVEVRNGAGVNGLAARTTALLRRRGFDVLETGTAGPADSSTVTVRNGTRADAAHVAGALGLPVRRVVPGGPADENAPTVSVTLGRDYADYVPLRQLD